MILTTVTLEGGVDAALALVPAAPGVGQILAAEDRNLVIGRPSNLRRWVAGHLGRARPPKVVAGRIPPRPPTDLTPIAVAIGYVRTQSAFGQRLAFERVMARYVPLAKRRDLKRPAWLRVDGDAPLPRILVQPGPAGTHVFGPFRDSRAATRARDALDKHFRIRPCDFGFKPPVGVPAGLAEQITRALAAGAEIVEIPPWVQPPYGRSLIAEDVKGHLEVYPVAGGAVLEEGMLDTGVDGLEPAIAGIDWTAPLPPRDDVPWLNSWRHGKHSGVEVRLRDDEPASAIAARIREVLGGDGAAVGAVVG